MKDVVAFLESNQVPYVIVGGIAVILWGRLRTTTDVDLIINHHKLDKDQFYQYINEIGYQLDYDDLVLGFRERSNISIWSGRYRIDLKGIYNRFAQLSLDQAIKIRVTAEFEVQVDRPELLIVSKLIYASEQDFEDTAAIYKKLKTENKLNEEYLTKIAETYRVLDRLPILEKITTGKLTGKELEEILDNLEPLDFDEL